MSQMRFVPLQLQVCFRGEEEIKHTWRDPLMDLLVSIQHGELIVLPAVMLLHFNASGCT